MTRNQSRFIPGEEIQVVSDWNFGAVDPSVARFAAKLKAQADGEQQIELARVEKIRQSGYSEGYAEGFTQGSAQATMEGQKQIADYIATQGQEAARTFGQLFATAKVQLANTEELIARGVLDLACDIARQVIRHELATSPDVLAPVIKEAVGMLVADARAAVVRMNPADMDVVSMGLKENFPTISLSLVADSAIQKGGCVLESAGTVIDAKLEHRWRRAVASLGMDASWEQSDGHD